MINTKYIKKKIEGPVFSIITPFLQNGKIDYTALQKYINYLYINGAKTFYVMFYNSRLGLLDEKEVLKLNKFCIDIVKKLNKKNIIICAEPYHCSTEKSIKYVKIFKNYGADIVSLIFGEKFYNENQVFNHFKLIHNKTKICLLLHQQLLENGLPQKKPYTYYSINLLDKIMNLKRFVAMKEDAKNEAYTKKICQKISNKAIIITSGGGKKQWIKANKFGCQSWLSGISNLNPQIAFDFYQLVKNKDNIELKKYIKYLEEPFFKIVKKYGWHLAIKASLELNKNFKRTERSPMTSIDNPNYIKLKKSLIQISKKSKIVFEKNYLNIN
ncbi:hypothetical protein AKH19_06625 [Pelagibacteraceae bacterium GOM-A1]|nr:hypothetical protein AKH19_06625 [Pelagibacteraceae bacterium GOM-A1]